MWEKLIQTGGITSHHTFYFILVSFLIVWVLVITCILTTSFTEVLFSLVFILIILFLVLLLVLLLWLVASFATSGLPLPSSTHLILILSFESWLVFWLVFDSWTSIGLCCISSCRSPWRFLTLSSGRFLLIFKVSIVVAWLLASSLSFHISLKFPIQKFKFLLLCDSV